VDGWVGASDLELDPDSLLEIDEAIAASGAGTDNPPQPPPHVLAASADDGESE
jgi:hypothetical protein